MRLLLTALLVIALAYCTPFDAHASHDQGCPEIILAYFGERSHQACSVAWCESSWRSWAVSLDGANVGYFQINRPSWGWRASTDPDVNVSFAHQLSRGGYDWSNWSCKP